MTRMLDSNAPEHAALLYV